MRFVFLTPIRVAPDQWMTWREHVRGLFARQAVIAGFKCHFGQRLEVLAGAHRAADQAPPEMGDILASLNAQDMYQTLRPALGADPGDCAHIILLRSGEICRVDMVEMTAADSAARHARTMQTICDSLEDDLRALAPCLPSGLSAARLCDGGRTAVHTLMAYDSALAEERDAVDLFFAREGLALETPGGQAGGRAGPFTPGPFTPGWSFSALACSDPHDIGLFAAVVMRLQAVWYQQRGQRDFCILQARLLAQQDNIDVAIVNSHEVMRRLFDFTLWEHELREFSANLKPWLKRAFDQLHDFWDMAQESAYIEKTLKQSHELLASGYQSRMLIQERQQSRLLFIIAAAGLLGVMGSLMSIWTALVWGGIVSMEYWASDAGGMVLIGLVMALLLMLVVVLYRFVSTQFR